MTLGPLFRREFMAPKRGRPVFQERVAGAILLGLTGLAICGVLFEIPGGVGRGLVPTPEARRLWLGRVFFLTAFSLELLFLLLRVPDVVGAAVAEERDKDTLSWLILTRLTSSEIVATKVVARGLRTMSIVLVGLPLLIGSAVLAGLEAEIPLALAVLGSTAGFAASLSIMAGIQATPVAAAKGRAYAQVVGWLVVPPVLTVIPVRIGTIWGDFLAEIKVAAGLVAPLSPLSLATDLGWLFRPTADRLEIRVAVMVALQAAAGLVALGLAATWLQSTDRPAGRGDPARGGRARCGHDPIFWREYELPATSTARPGLLTAVRHLVLLCRALVFNVLAILGTALALAIPLAILGATIYFGSAALQEEWRISLSTEKAGAYAARDRFNGVIRYISGIVLFFPILGVPATVIARFTVERDKQTWDEFLMTPLEGGEILRSKARVAWHGFRRLVWWVAPIWVIGIASGALMPLGVVLGAADFALMIWVMIALGLSWGVRPFPPDAISNRVLLATLVLFVMHAPVLGILSLSPREFAAAREWSPLFLPGFALAGLAVALVTAGVARYTWRRTVARFDDWVDRPRRGPGDIAPG